MKVIDCVPNEVIKLRCSRAGKIVFLPFEEDFNEAEFSEFLKEFRFAQKVYLNSRTFYYVSKT